MTCITQIGASVRLRRHWILGDGDEVMLFHSEKLATPKTMPAQSNPLGRWGLRAISALRAVVDE